VNDLITRLYLRATEWSKGQDMVEYSLIVAAVAIVAWVGYQVLGTSVSTYVIDVGGDL
jgi:Flp pilus assembly pilin Flp